MAPKFNPSGFSVEAEPKSPDDKRVVKIESESVSEVRNFEFQKLSQQSRSTYSYTKERLGPLAATDDERQAKSQREARFSINSLLRTPLKIEEEERRVIEERVRTRIAAVSEEAKAEAAAVGYKEGHEKGYEDAKNGFLAENAERFKVFENLLKGFENAKHDIFKANERALIEMIFRVSRMVILREISTDKDYLLRLTTELIERVGVRENIRVKIHPDSLAAAASLREGLEKKLGELKNFNVDASPTVAFGGCVLETEFNSIDATVETQLAAIHETLSTATTGAN